jgi:hypothetical protein
MDKKMTDDLQVPEAELARLADGSLPETRQTELQAELRRSPALTSALAEQQRAVSLLRAIDTPAPDSLRQWLESQTEERQTDERPAKRRRGWAMPRFAFPAALGVAAAAIAAAVVIAVGGGSSSPTLGQAAHAALAASTMPAPNESGAMTLDVSAGGIPFPYWEHTVGWNAIGARSDSIGGRHAVTVFYEAGGRRVGYTIVTGPPVQVKGGVTVTAHGTPYTFMRTGSARLITWVRNGHTCVIAGHGVTYKTLLGLATADFPA